MNIFEMNHVKKHFGKLEVLKDISFGISPGEVVSIIGPSGSGKSTILRCGAMLENIDGGSFSYHGEKAAWEENGKVIYAAKDKLNQLKRTFGLVFQNFNLFPHYSVIKNIIDAPIHVQKRDKEEVYDEAMAILERIGLKDKKDAYPYQLSGGQAQRVAIARALALKPKLLYFDEPTSSLDPQLTGEVLKVIKDLAEEKMTMVIVTHEMKFAHDISDRMIFMNKGVIVMDSDPDSMFSSDNPEIKEFLGILENTY